MTIYRLAIGAPAPPASFDLATEIAAIRAHEVYGAAFSATDSPYAAGGLAAPTAPNITSEVTVDSWADFATEAASPNGKRIILNSAFSPHTATSIVTIAGEDCEIVFTGNTINGPVASGIFSISSSSSVPSRIKVIGGTLNGGIGDIKGRDIHLYNITGTGLMDTSSGASSACGTVAGQRVVLERMLIRDYANGFFFIDALSKARYSATISGTTLTVTSVNWGTIEVGDYVNYLSGGSDFSIPDGTVISALGTGTGGTGTYTLSNTASLTGTGNFTSRIPSSSIILANSDAECPDNPPGATWVDESTTRFNGAFSAIVLKSRVFCTPKASLRAHAGYLGLYQPTTYALWKDVQFENSAVQAQEPGESGVFPGVENIWMDNCRGYNSLTTVAVQAPHYSQLSTISVTGDGTTATLSAAGQYVKTGITAGEVVDIAGAINPAFNATGVVLTPTGNQTATYASTAVGTTVVNINRTKILVNNFWAQNNHLYGVGAVDDTGWTPSGLGSPAAGWTTVTNTATSYANGNIQYTYVSTPAWSRA